MQLKLQDVDYIRSAGQTGAGPRAAGAWPGHFKRFTTTSLSCPGKWIILYLNPQAFSPSAHCLLYSYLFVLGHSFTLLVTSMNVNSFADSIHSTRALSIHTPATHFPPQNSIPPSSIFQALWSLFWPVFIFRFVFVFHKVFGSVVGL